MIEQMIEVPRTALGRRHAPDRTAPHDIGMVRILDLDDVGTPVCQDASGDGDDPVTGHVEDTETLEQIH